MVLLPSFVLEMVSTRCRGSTGEVLNMALRLCDQQGLLLHDIEISFSCTDISAFSPSFETFCIALIHQLDPATHLQYQLAGS